MQLHFKLKSEVVYILTIQVVGSSSKQVAMGITAAVLVGALLVVMLYVVFKHGTKARSVVLSLVTKEGKMVWGVLGEGFDMAGDYGMFFAIQAALNDTETNRRNAAPVYIPALVSLVVSTVISLLALAVRFAIMVIQLRRRRRELKGFGQRKSYVEQLDIKIEDAERQCKQTYIGIALALFEQVPMGGIGIFFLSQRYAAPWFPIASVFSSGVMLGMKVASITTLPYWWAKLKKWQASATPVVKDAALGTELAATAVGSGDAPNGEDGVATLALGLQELRSHTLRVAHSAEALALPAKAQADALTKVVAELAKMDHKLALYYDHLLSAPADPEPEPEPSIIEVIQCALCTHSCVRHGADARPPPCDLVLTHSIDGGVVRGVLCAQRMLKTRNRRHLPECITRLFGVDNVDTKAFEELVRQARKPKADRPKAQLIPARRSLALSWVLPRCGLDE